METILGFLTGLSHLYRGKREIDMPIDRKSGVIRSKENDIVIPGGFVHDFILQHVLKDFDPALPYETELATDATSTYGWFLDTYRQCASWLRRKGIKQGDRVAFYSKSLIEFSPCVLATWRVGAACTFIRPEMISDVAYRKSVGIPRIVFASKDKMLQLVEAGFDNIVVYRCSPAELPVGAFSFDEVLKEEVKEPSDFQIEGDPNETLAIVSFTGGTTGNPKPIQLSHRNVISVFACETNGVALTFGKTEENLIHVCPFPTVHLAGILYRMSPLLHHGRSILLDPPAPARDICEAIQKYHANVITVVPVSLISLMRFPELPNYDLSSWKTCIVIGGPLMAFMKATICQQFGLNDLYQRLGMSEYCGSVLSSSNVPGSIGCLCPNADLKVINLDDGSPITEPGVVGEFYVRAPQVMIGYYNLPETNKAAFDEDGFLRTGDLVSFDKDLNFYYFDRVQEIIRHQSGRMISATELELIIAYQNETVSEVSVIQSDDGPRAIVVPVVWPEDEEALRNDIISRTNQVLDEPWKQLTGGVTFLRAEEVPRSVLGKHLKRLMKHF